MHEENLQPIHDAVIMIKLYSREIKDYYIVFPALDHTGKVTVCKQWIKKQLSKHQIDCQPIQLENYSSTLLIGIVNLSELKKIADASDQNKVYLSHDAYGNLLQNVAKNKEYKPQSIFYEFRNNMDLDVTFRAIRINQ